MWQSYQRGTFWPISWQRCSCMPACTQTDCRCKRLQAGACLTAVVRTYLVLLFTAFAITHLPLWSRAPRAIRPVIILIAPYTVSCSYGASYSWHSQSWRPCAEWTALTSSFFSLPTWLPITKLVSKYRLKYRFWIINMPRTPYATELAVRNTKQAPACRIRQRVPSN